MLVTCKNCEVEINPAFLNCRFCEQQVLPEKERMLSDNQKQELLTFAKAINTKLKATKKGSNPLIFALFFVFFLALIGLGFWMNTSGFRTSSITWTLIGVGIVLFIGWGGTIEILENRAIKKGYYESIHKDIVNFLEARGYYRYEFDMVISEKLDEKAPIKQFAFDSQIDFLAQSPY